MIIQPYNSPSCYLQYVFKLLLHESTMSFNSFPQPQKNINFVFLELNIEYCGPKKGVGEGMLHCQNYYSMTKL